MRKLTILLVLLLVAATAHAAKNKNKHKDKRFEPAVREMAQYAGSYRGPSEVHGLVLDVRNGRLSGTYVELGRVAVLHDFVLDGADFTATASFDDGSSRQISGSFAIRILNGETAFGARLHDVWVEGFGVINTFFEKME
jgi:hypothetical protein